MPKFSARGSALLRKLQTTNVALDHRAAGDGEIDQLRRQLTLRHDQRETSLGPLWAELAGCYTKAGDFTQAIDCYRSAINDPRRRGSAARRRTARQPLVPTSTRDRYRRDGARFGDGRSRMHPEQPHLRGAQRRTTRHARGPPPATRPARCQASRSPASPSGDRHRRLRSGHHRALRQLHLSGRELHLPHSPALPRRRQLGRARQREPSTTESGRPQARRQPISSDAWRKTSPACGRHPRLRSRTVIGRHRTTECRPGAARKLSYRSRGGLPDRTPTRRQRGPAPVRSQDPEPMVHHRRALRPGTRAKNSTA